MTRSLRFYHGQSIIEFSVGMVVVGLIMYGMVAAFRWGMMDMAERRYDQDQALMNMITPTTPLTPSLMNQILSPRVHEQRPMDIILRQK